MNPDDSLPPAIWRIMLTSAAVIVLILAAFSVRSIILALRSSEQGPVPGPPPVAQAPASPSPASPPPTPSAPTGVQSSQGAHDFSKDFDMIRKREEAQKETLRILRKEAQENPNADNILTEEQLKQMEKSGALVM